MQWILNAIIRYKNLLLYLFCTFLSLYFSSVQSSFHQNQLKQSSLFLAGIIYQPYDQLKSYFDLVDENQRLIKENNSLRTLLLEKFDPLELNNNETRNQTDLNYWSLPAKIIRNSFNKSRNVLLIDKGEKEGVMDEMGVIGPKGIIGIINQTSRNFASVLSILNLDLKINAKFKGSNVFGSLHWVGGGPIEMQLEDISVINPVKVGDTILTGGMSSYFPEGIPIGSVSSFTLPKNGGYYQIKVKLFTNMTDLNDVYVIGNKNREEIKTLLKSKQ